jgi:hypothetical protein
MNVVVIEDFSIESTPNYDMRGMRILETFLIKIAALNYSAHKLKNFLKFLDRFRKALYRF